MGLSIQQQPQGLVFKVYVQPRSSKNAIVGLHQDALKIKLKAPPVDGEANKLCLKYLSKCLSVPKSSLEIRTGQSSRTKQILFKYEGQGTPTEVEVMTQRLLGLVKK